MNDKYDKFIELYKHYGWSIKTGDEQVYGSPSDIYAELIDVDGVKYFMEIDDGNCENQLDDAVYTIWIGNFDNTILQGRIGELTDFKVVMKVLGIVNVVDNNTGCLPTVVTINDILIDRFDEYVTSNINGGIFKSYEEIADITGVDFKDVVNIVTSDFRFKRNSRNKFTTLNMYVEYRGFWNRFLDSYIGYIK